MLAAGTLLAACSEPETYLPGERLEPRAVLEGPRAAGAGEAPLGARPIALPPQRRNADWAQAHGTPGLRVDHAALSAAPQLAFAADIGAGDSKRLRISADPVVAGGRIFTLDASAQVAATSTAGQTLWTRSLVPLRDNAGEASGGGLAFGGGAVFVSSGFGTLTALDPASGAILWEQDLGAPGTGTPAYRDGLVYVVSGDTTAWAIEAATGRVRWQIDAASDINNIYGGPAPAFTDDLAIFAYGSGEVQGVFRQGGLQLWSAAVLGRRPGRAAAFVGDITGAPVVAGGRVYVGNHSGRLVALNAGSGERVWTAKEGTFGPVWPAGDSVFAISDRNALLRLDAASGALLWSVELPGFVTPNPKKAAEIHAHYGPVLAGGRLWVASSDGVLRGFDPASGALAAQAPIPGGASTAPVVAGGTLYLVSKEGRLLAYR